MASSKQKRQVSVASLMEQIGRCAYGQAFARDLNPAQWTALRYFGDANRFSRSVTGFARFHGTTLGTASQTVKSLVSKRYLCRRPDKQDRRKSRIDLTAKAKRALKRDPIGVIERAASELRESERMALGSSLRFMLAKLHDEDSCRSFGICTDCRYLCCKQDCVSAQAPYFCNLVKENLSEPELILSCINFEASA